MKINNEWLDEFRYHSTRFFGVYDIESFDEEIIKNYVNLPPAEAARQFGEDYELLFIDAWTSKELVQLHYGNNMRAAKL